MRENLTKRFFKYVKKTKTCWVWMGAKTSRGYGVFNPPHNKQTVSHRFHWEMKKGKIPEGMFICHKCDNRPCIRISHLFIGTAQDNTNDMVKKGRECWGEKCHNSRLSNEDVAEIRFLYRSRQGGILGRIYGVSHKHIWQIIKKKRWKH